MEAAAADEAATQRAAEDAAAAAAAQAARCTAPSVAPCGDAAFTDSFAEALASGFVLVYPGFPRSLIARTRVCMLWE